MDAGSILFVSPVEPQPSNNGLAMRAHAVLGSLAKQHWVHLAVAAGTGSATTSTAPPFPGIHRVPLPPAGTLRRGVDGGGASAPPSEWSRPTARQLAALNALDERVGFERIHVMRLYMAPFAVRFLGRLPCDLDLDDIESRNRERCARAAAAAGRQDLARSFQDAARFFAERERRWLPRFDRVYVCSKADRAVLIDVCAGVDARVLPNVVRAVEPLSPPPRDGPVRLLLVGTMGYFPNRDAVAYVLDEILPRVRRRARRAVELDVVGTGSAELGREFPQLSGVSWRGFVEDLRPSYAAAHVVLAPLRAGGGTRIKLLEAFAHGRPVVSTRVGAEGLDVIDGEHLLLGETPDDLADCCVRILSEEGLAARLAARARDFVVAHHTPAAIDFVLAGGREETGPGSESEVLLSVVVTAGAGGSMLGRRLAVLAAQTMPRAHFEVIVLDEPGSGDDVSAMVAEPDNFRRLRVPAAGALRAMNAALRAARGRYVTFLEPDVCVNTTWAEAVVAAFRETVPPPAVIAGRVISHPGPTPSDTATEKAHFLSPRGLERSVRGACLAFDRRRLLEAGGFVGRRRGGANLRTVNAEAALRVAARLPLVWSDPRAAVQRLEPEPTRRERRRRQEP